MILNALLLFNLYAKIITKTKVLFLTHMLLYNNYINFLNCQSEVRIFEEKNEKYHGFTLTKGRVLYIDISRFSEPEEAATNEVGTTLTGC